MMPENVKVVAAPDAKLATMLAEMVGLGQMLGGHDPWGSPSKGDVATNRADAPAGPPCGRCGTVPA